jgi:polo-like kinase 1
VDESGEESELMKLKMEGSHCSRGSIKVQLRKRIKFSEEETIRYLRDIITGVVHLPDNRLLHRDLKLESFLMDEHGIVRVGDFRVSAKLEHDNERRFTVCGTPNYMCHELIAGSQGVSYEVDMCAIGVATFGMLTGKMPFQGIDKKDTYALIRKCTYAFPENSRLSFHARQFISGILQIDPQKRPSARDLLEHPFIGQRPPPRPPLQQLRNTIRVKPVVLTPVPDYFVSRFCDHSEKYGLGYMLVNGTVGACFHDSSRMAMDPHAQFIQDWESYAVQRPDVLRKDNEAPKKKITILLRIAESLKKTVSMFHIPGVRLNPETPLTHVKYWLRTERATLFRMADRNIQVNFVDRNKLFIFWALKELMLVPTVFDHGKLISLSKVSNHPADSEEKTRFLIAKEMLAILSHSCVAVNHTNPLTVSLPTFFDLYRLFISGMP